MEQPVEQAPCSDQIATAAGLRTLHVHNETERRCWWCFRPWPCPDRRWSDRILRLAREVRRGDPPQPVHPDWRDGH